MRIAIKKYLESRGSDTCFRICLYLFVAALPVGHGLDAIFLVFLSLSWFFVSPMKEKVLNLNKHRLSLFLVFGLHLVFWFGTLYSEDLKVAFGRVERSLALVVLPIIVLSLDKRFFDLKKIFYALGIGLSIAMMISWANIVMDILSKPWPMKQARYFFEWIYTHDNLLRAIDIHPGYFVLSLVLFLSAYMNGPLFKKLYKKKVIYFISLFLFLLFLVETTSRMGFLCLLVILVVDSFRGKNKKIRWVHLGIILGLLFAATQFEYLQTKFERILDSNGSIAFERYYRWGNILEVFSENNSWFLGVGTGDVYQIYQEAYQRGDFPLALNENYNAHNQYIETLVGSGLFGLLLYLSLLFNFMIKTRLKESAFAFFVLIVIFSITESFLIRSKGVFFLAFFYSLFINHYTRENGREKA